VTNHYPLVSRLELLHQVAVINKLLQPHISKWLSYYEIKSMLGRQSGVFPLLKLAFPNHKFAMEIIVVPYLGNIVVPFDI
jgi:hypothetical protein